MRRISTSARTRMRTCLLVPLCALAASPTSAGDVGTSDALRREILTMDARFSDAYANCSVQGMRALFTNDAELVFAERGIQHGVAEHADELRRRNCTLRREAPASGQQIHALPGHVGALDGALQVGSQIFCVRDTQPCRGTSTQFVAVWRRTPDGWKISRLIRYGYLQAY